jgi:SSS family solute:Na+ symporter
MLRAMTATAAVVGIYMLAMIAVGFYLRERIRSVTDFLVAGRKLGLALTTATMAAVQIGAGVILGGAELAAQDGAWPGMWYGLGCGGGLVLAGWLVAPRIRGQNAYVPLDYFGRRYGESRPVRFWAWLSNIPSLLGVFVAQLMASGNVFTLFGFTYAEGVWASALVIMLYCVVSGMWGAVVTDFAQVAIILVGVPAVTFTVASGLGGDSGASAGSLLATPFIPEGMASRAVFIILPFLLSISVSYDAFMRYQSAKSAQVARWGCILAGLLLVGISFCVGISGAAGRVLYPGLEAGAVLPHIIQVSLSPVLAGIVLSAILAAAMSSANSLLISLAGCFTRDLYNKVIHPAAELEELRHSALISRVVVVVAVALGIGVALEARGILYTMIIFNYPYMGSLLVPLLGGVLWKGATREGAIAAMFVGGAVGVVSFLAGVPSPLEGWMNVDLALLIAYVASAVVFVGVSLATRKEASLA